MNLLALALILIPTLAAFVSFLVESSFLVSIINIVSSFILLLSSLYLSHQIFDSPELINSEFFIFDPLSAFSIRLIAIISFLVFLYSASYLNSLKEQKQIDDKVFHNYYLFANLFLAAMFSLSLMNNIAASWITVEATTLTSALLLGLYRDSRYLEAAWKYIIVCTVGILVALLGIVLFITSITNANAHNIFSFSDLTNSEIIFSPNLAKVAFVMIFIGYGTKVGLVPMHTWLPDTYQNSPSPISALFTSTLSSLVLIPILRFKNIIDLNLGDCGFTNGLFCFFGFITVVFAAIFLVNQFDFKRLLAYSSIENLGLIVLALGLGTKFALTAAFLHIIFHALAKTVLFFTTGNLFIKYHLHQIDKVRAIFNKLPLTGLAIILGVFAITGLPPFALFTSKFMILRELIITNIYLAVFVLIAFIMVFGSFIHYFNKILFIEKEGVDYYIETPISLKTLNFIAIAIPLSLLFYFGLFMPDALFQNIEKIVGVISLN